MPEAQTDHCMTTVGNVPPFLQAPRLGVVCIWRW